MKKRILCALLALLLTGCGTGAVAETTVETTEPVPVHAHSYIKTVTPVTCTTDGYTTVRCKCGIRYLTDRVRHVGHQYTAEMLEPTWEEGGYTDYTCHCGDTYRADYVQCRKYATLPPSESGEVLHFFDDAAFIGDSVTQMLQYYQAQYGTFGDATFLATVSFSLAHAVNRSMKLTYKGQQMNPEDALKACGAKKVFILLGVNDVANANPENAIRCWQIIVSRIRAKNPDIQIYIQSGTPIYTDGQRSGVTNANMDEYNAHLKVFAEANGCFYVDIATPMKDETGGLKKEYCSDSFVHMTYEGCDAWALALKDYVNQLP